MHNPRARYRNSITSNISAHCSSNGLRRWIPLLQHQEQRHKQEQQQEQDLEQQQGQEEEHEQEQSQKQDQKQKQELEQEYEQCSVTPRLLIAMFDQLLDGVIQKHFLDDGVFSAELETIKDAFAKSDLESPVYTRTQARSIIRSVGCRQAMH